jgi:hypothetical protein
VSYVIEGVFARVGVRVVQLEVLATDQGGALARSLPALWLKKAGVGRRPSGLPTVRRPRR